MGSIILIVAVAWLLLLVFAVALCHAMARGDRREGSALVWTDVRIRRGSRSVRRWMALSELRSRRHAARH